MLFSWSCLEQKQQHWKSFWWMICHPHHLTRRPNSLNPWLHHPWMQSPAPVNKYLVWPDLIWPSLHCGRHQLNPNFLRAILPTPLWPKVNPPCFERQSLGEWKPSQNNLWPLHLVQTTITLTTILILTLHFPLILENIKVYGVSIRLPE